ncbi:MAG: hypothetical protein QM820_24210 [Minicystis sp.]
MISRHWFVPAAAAALLSTGACAAPKPETFCQDWVSKTCATIAGCCAGGAVFDEQACILELSQSCQKATAVERVHAGEVQFDSVAANECFGVVSSCTDLQHIDADTSFAHRRACSNVVTGFRLQGTACVSSEDCERTGEFATCYKTSDLDDSGVCVKVVRDEETCSFSFDTYELRVCPDGKSCDLSGFKPYESDAPTVRSFAFDAKCVSDVPEGGACSGEHGLRCAKGLHCDQSSSDRPTCKAPKGQGSPCAAHEECADGLICQVDASGTTATCEENTNSAYCVAPG